MACIFHTCPDALFAPLLLEFPQFLENAHEPTFPTTTTTTTPKGNNFQAKGLSDLEHELGSKAVEEAGEDIDKVNATENLDHSEEVDGCKSKTWIMGTIIFVSGSLLNFASYSFAAQSLLACLEAVQFVTNLLFGKFLLKAPVSTKQYIGTVIIIFTVLVCIWFAGKGTLDKSIPELIVLFGNIPFLAYTIFMAIAVVSLYSIHMKYQAAEDNHNALPYSSSVLQYSYATGFALFGTLSVVLAKCMAEVVEIWGFDFKTFSVTGKNIWVHWFWWAVVVGWLCFMLIWLNGLNGALGKYNPVFIIPLLQINFILFAIISGGIFFEEFGEFCAPQFIGFGLGVIGSFYGLYLLIPEDADVATEPVRPATAPGSRRPSIVLGGVGGGGGRRTSLVTSMATLHQHHNHHQRRVSTALREKRRESIAQIRSSRTSSSLQEDIDVIRREHASMADSIPEPIPEGDSGDGSSSDEDAEAPNTETRIAIDAQKRNTQQL